MVATIPSPDNKMHTVTIRCLRERPDSELSGFTLDFNSDDEAPIYAKCLPGGFLQLSSIDLEYLLSFADFMCRHPEP